MGAESQGPQGAWDRPNRASTCWLLEPCVLEVRRPRRPGSSGFSTCSCSGPSGCHPVQLIQWTPVSSPLPLLPEAFYGSHGVSYNPSSSPWPHLLITHLPICSCSCLITVALPFCSLTLNIPYLGHLRTFAYAISPSSLLFLHLFSELSLHILQALAQSHLVGEAQSPHLSFQRSALPIVFMVFLIPCLFPPCK